MPRPHEWASSLCAERREYIPNTSELYAPMQRHVIAVESEAAGSRTAVSLPPMCPREICLVQPSMRVRHPRNKGSGMRKRKRRKRGGRDSTSYESETMASLRSKWSSKHQLAFREFMQSSAQAFASAPLLPAPRKRGRIQRQVLELPRSIILRNTAIKQKFGTQDPREWSFYRKKSHKRRNDRRLQKMKKLEALRVDSEHRLQETFGAWKYLNGAFAKASSVLGDYEFSNELNPQYPLLLRSMRAHQQRLQREMDQATQRVEHARAAEHKYRRKYFSSRKHDS